MANPAVHVQHPEMLPPDFDAVLKRRIVVELGMAEGEDVPIAVSNKGNVPGAPEFVYVVSFLAEHLPEATSAVAGRLAAAAANVAPKVIIGVISKLIADGLVAAVRRAVEWLRRTGDYPPMRVE